jgi:hypothetical protein
MWLLEAKVKSSSGFKSHDELVKGGAHHVVQGKDDVYRLHHKQDLGKLVNDWKASGYQLKGKITSGVGVHKTYVKEGPYGHDKKITVSHLDKGRRFVRHSQDRPID